MVVKGGKKNQPKVRRNDRHEEREKLSINDLSAMNMPELREFAQKLEIPRDVLIAIVITSYSIHYTKLYEGAKSRRAP